MLVRSRRLQLAFAAAILVVAIPGNARGQTYSLSAPSAGSSTGSLELNISQSGKGVTDPIPDESLVTNQQMWHLTVYRKVDNHLQVADPVVVTSIVANSDYRRTGHLILATSANFALDPYTNPTLVIEIDFLNGPLVSSAMFTPKAPASPPTSPAPSGGSASSNQTTGCGSGLSAHQPGTNYADYCFSGIWVPQVGSHPLYSTNSNFALAHEWGPGSLGIRAQESADGSVVLDPNAFSSAIFYQAVLTNSPPLPPVMGAHFMGLLLYWNLATVEFDRKKKNTNLGTNVNLITSPELVLPISLPRWRAGLEIDAGIEAGHNFKNNINSNGFGTIFRGLLGAQAGKLFTPHQPVAGISKIKLTSQYQVRLLEDDEVITRSIHGKLVPFVGHQARNWVSTELDFMFTDNFGLTLRHDYGSLPPAYVFIENRATVGFTVQSAQKKTQ